MISNFTYSDTERRSGKKDKNGSTDDVKSEKKNNIKSSVNYASRSLNVLKKSKKDRRLSISGPFLSGRYLPQRAEDVLPEKS